MCVPVWRALQLGGGEGVAIVVAAAKDSVVSQDKLLAGGSRRAQLREQTRAAPALAEDRVQFTLAFQVTLGRSGGSWRREKAMDDHAGAESTTGFDWNAAKQGEFMRRMLQKLCDGSALAAGHVQGEG